ncbi:hypothetical protein B0H10DRAFT_2217439 [Mycena sp. CBHHK59/15]|nr:hypothetical protein B0H10DRAFT_2242605 [Mycena sp. CBHHK59/15]KAJ6618703.1 hypothetical protein B0H10DRAFT_2217439 [Mycena sp. CBHHK59/15]
MPVVPPSPCAAEMGNPPLSTAPDFACTSTLRHTPKPLPRAAQSARRLLQLGVVRVASDAEMRVLEKWARRGTASGFCDPPLREDEDEKFPVPYSIQESAPGEKQCEGTAEKQADKENMMEEQLENDSVLEKTRMWWGGRWGV